MAYRRTRIMAAGLAVLATAAGPALAHHSLTAYNGRRRKALEGEVVKFSFSHPHPYLVVKAAEPGRPPVDWKLEMDNLAELSGIGMSIHTFRAGDRVSVSGDPAKDGSPTMYLRHLDRPKDGLHYEQERITPVLRKGG